MNFESSNECDLYILKDNQMKLVGEIQLTKRYGFTQCDDKGKNNESL
jgi:hypothetical protein